MKYKRVVEDGPIVDRLSGIYHLKSSETGSMGLDSLGFLVWLGFVCLFFDKDTEADKTHLVSL